MPGRIVEQNGRRFLLTNDDIYEVKPLSAGALDRIVGALPSLAVDVEMTVYFQPQPHACIACKVFFQPVGDEDACPTCQNGGT